MRRVDAAAIAVVMLVAGGAVGFLVSNGTSQASTVSRTVKTTVFVTGNTPSGTTLTSTVTTSVLVTRTAAGIVGYHVANVTNDMNVLAEGYIFLSNNSVRFEGVNFTTLCPNLSSSCGYQITVTRIPGIPSAGWIELQMTFPDGKNETLVSNVGSSDYTILLSQHSNPTAGVEFQYVAQTSQYEVFLRVSK